MQTFASMLAAYVKKNLEVMPRGAMLVRCINDNSTVAAVFGNDNYMASLHTQREVELVRRQLGQARVEELGFGLSPDGSSWALLVKPDPSRYQTAAGQAFHMEMFRILLEDTVNGAWSHVSGPSPDNGGRRGTEQKQPAP
jgi:hypothetical protein